MADEFDTDKGVKGDYPGTILDAYFQANERGDTELVLKVRSDDPDDGGEEEENRYRVGQDWASFDGGLTVEHPSKNRIRANSQLATLVERAMACDPSVEGVFKSRSEGKGQKTAAIWPGTSWFWVVDETPFDFKNAAGEEVKGTSYKAYPSKYLGLSEQLTLQDTAAASSEVPPEILAKLKVLAVSKNFNEWIDEALTIDWVRDNMVSALSDEGYYNSLKGA